MDELTQLILDTVTANGPDCAWQTIVDAVPFNQRQLILPRVITLVRDGTLTRQMSVENGSMQLTFSVA